MTKVKLIFSTIFIVFILAFAPHTSVKAYDSGYIGCFDSNKVINVCFNMPVDFNGDINNYIKVVDCNDKPVEVKLEQSADKISVRVLPPKGGYEQGEKYSLVFEKGIKPIIGEPLKNKTIKTFKINKTLYVSEQKCAGVEDGSFEKPYTSIDKVVSNAEPGTTIYLRGGKYCGFTIANKNGSENDYYVIKNYQGETVELCGRNHGKVGITIHNSSYWKIEGIDIHDYLDCGIYVANGSNHIQMNNLKIWNIDEVSDSRYGKMAIEGENNTSYCTVSNCILHDIGQHRKLGLDHGIYLTKNARSWTIENNDIYNCAGVAIHIAGSHAGRDCIIKNNKLHDNDYHGMEIASNSDNNQIIGNKFYGNKNCDVYIKEASCGNVFKYNTFGSSNSTYNIAFEDESSRNNVFDYNKYIKADTNRAIRLFNGTISFDKWKALSQEANGQLIR
jgi:parallel beta-helix repeat protein